jgi:regulator of protease activity HflC (stomatin/prohibitin superfamily)
MTVQKKPFISLRKIIALVVIVVVAIALVSTFGGATATVPAGYKGILLNFGSVAGTLDPGFHWISPIGQQVVLVSTQTQSAQADENAASSDLQEITTSVTVNYQIDPAYVQEVYTALRDQYQARVIIPAMQDGLKASTAKYQASELITRREDAKNSFQVLLQQKLNQYHIIITSVSITNFKFSDQFQSAVDAKVTAEQNALAAQNQLAVVQFQAQQQIIQAQAAANATIAKANGDATAKIIGAQAQSELQALLNQNMTQAYLSYLYLQNWNGQLPTYYGGQLPIPFFNIGNATSNSTTP